MLYILSAPATVDPGAPFSATFRVLNYSGVPWAANAVRIGSQSPQDTLRWGKNRVALPGDLAPGASVDVVGVFTAPAVSASYLFAWQMVDEGVAWLPPTASQPLQVGTNTAQPPPEGVLEPVILLGNLPPPRPDGSLVGAMVLNTSPYSFGLGSRFAIWPYKGTQPFAILSCRLWTGVDRGGVTDVYAEVRRAPAGWTRQSGTPNPDGTLLQFFMWDHYAEPTGIGHADQAFAEPGIILQPGEQLEMWFLANDIAGQGPNKHAHQLFTILGRYLPR